MTIPNDRLNETAAQCVTISDHSELPAALRTDASFCYPGFSCSDFAVEVVKNGEQPELTERGF